ncbi:phytoene/squalene synthetase [Mucilaginibacter gracilis]|uniref:Phytoene/squalene synthetase n=1 Tax=Mucilaginibacter gracilis TaxID=423350 RepID=A0A495J032_9SPHI|nr:phytoene/squalene synthase family protein [Mucilaginibacter gracilis]RKR81654.1 phytoene/squalene synthetase [Mucilaginibacter gracilis]
MANQMDLYTETCFKCSKVITHQYSTSFGMGIKAFDKGCQDAIYAIYGFVRYADEIVDTFHGHDKAKLIAGFRLETFIAIEQGISLNPVLQSFQYVVNKYRIEKDLIEAFLRSMEMDLEKTAYTETGYQEYIYGSAEVVGLMCLRVFCSNDDELYRKLLPGARSLGAAFQKVNFLRDVRSDFEERGRTYFPGVDFAGFTLRDKQLIEADIQQDFDNAITGIRGLPKAARLGVYVAYVYYLQLFKKIKGISPQVILQKRVRINDGYKMALYVKALLKQRFNMI